jgi:tRNA modification GTPase
MRPGSDSVLDTIAALATPAGRSALALIRVSGRDAAAVLRSVAPAVPNPPPDRSPRLTTIRDEAGRPLDRGIVTFFAAPRSATGEDVAEISIHGSPVLVRRLLAALSAAGARQARAGEFTERAFLLGQVDLLEAEAVRDLIEARTEAAVRLSARRLEGKLSELVAEAREDLLASAAALSATIDFAEDVGETISPQIRNRLEHAQRQLSALLASYRTGHLSSAGWRIAILGRPNAGKSTLFNALAGNARAIVTDVPGTTRDTLEITLDIGGVPVLLTDTAGLRETADPVERIGVERARQAGQAADAVLYVFDASAGWTGEDTRDACWPGKPVLVVANKIDRTDPAARARLDGALAICGLAPETGEVLRESIERAIVPRVSTDGSADVLTTERQRDLVARACASAAATVDALERRDSPEYAVTHVEDALAALADLAGETTSEDVLKRIFETFCIGK